MEQKDRHSFVIYESQIETIRELGPQDGWRLLMGIADYALKNEEPEFEDKILKMLWISIKPQLDANRQKYENGCKGGAPKGSKNNPNGRRGKTKTNQELTETNQNLANDNVNVNVSYLSSNRKTNKETYTTTATTSTTSESVCLKTTDSEITDNAGAVAPERQVPTKAQVTDYFNQKGMAKSKAMNEADRFIDYNVTKNWAYLKNKTWQELAELWYAHKHQASSPRPSVPSATETDVQTTQASQTPAPASASTPPATSSPAPIIRPVGFDEWIVDGMKWPEFDAKINEIRADWWKDGRFFSIDLFGSAMRTAPTNEELFTIAHGRNGTMSVLTLLHEEKQFRDEWVRRQEEEKRRSEMDPEDLPF